MRAFLRFLKPLQAAEVGPIGELVLVNDGETVEGTLILMSEWKTKLPEYV